MLNILINKQKIECPCCGNVHDVEIRKRNASAKIKGSLVGYIEDYCYCDIENTIFWPGKMMDGNLKKIRNAYNMINNYVQKQNL